MTVPRVRVFAGPNGSGKSSLKSVIPKDLLGIYINADDILQDLQRRGQLDFRTFRCTPIATELRLFLESSGLFSLTGLDPVAFSSGLRNGVLTLPPEMLNAYSAATLAAFLREHMLAKKISFTFETVMSSPDKVELMRRARESGFRVYLYFIATADSRINVSRVQIRVNQGGHDVPESKIHDRYKRSLRLLYGAIQQTSRAYIFDNSTEQAEEASWIAEVTDGQEMALQLDQVPNWFNRYVLRRARFRRYRIGRVIDEIFERWL